MQNNKEEDKKGVKQKFLEQLQMDEGLSKALKQLLQNKPVEDKKALKILVESEIVNDKGELLCSKTDIEDMLKEREAKHTDPKVRQTWETGYIEKWQQMLDNGDDMLTYLAEQINPKVYGLLDVKKKILLCLASGEDKWGDRGRLHLLARGDPGTAKSALGEWLVHNLGIEGLSHRSSDVGLTGCVVGKEVIPGALPCANGGAIYIDELDKFDYKDYAGLLQAMESGEIVIRVGAVKARFDARCRVIASINNIEKLPPELLDRFDFKVEMVPPKLEEELMITENIVKQWWEKKASYFGEGFRRYLQWIKSYEPEFSAEVKDKAATIMKMYIELDKENMCGSMRKKESLIRIATTIAKIHRRAVMAEDFIEAIRLTNPSFNGVKLDAIKMKISQLQQN